MCQSDQTKDCARGHEIGFHRIAPRCETTLGAHRCIAVRLTAQRTGLYDEAASGGETASAACDGSARSLGDLVELFSVHCYTGHSRHGVHVQNQDQERSIQHALPLAREAVCGGGLEPEARVVLRMADDDNERAAPFMEVVQASSHKLRADALPLAIREHGHRGQSHPEDSWPRALDHHRGEEDVTHNGVILSHQ